jgi:hypothetical protein
MRMTVLFSNGSFRVFTPAAANVCDREAPRLAALLERALALGPASAANANHPRAPSLAPSR